MSEIPWLEKYRPTTLKDVVGNRETIDRLRQIAKQGNVPNMIISGPPGTGKTTSIHCLAFDLLGEDLYKTAVLELNASDSRGIDVVRNKIKMFAQQKINLPPGKHKVIILDEADNMTKAAQQALRRTMEIYSNTTRFALACNISSKIIEPIQSRCCILRYTRLRNKEIVKRVKEVMDMENITNFTEAGLNSLLFIAEGDMRNAINTLQSCVMGFGHVTQDTIMKICDQPSPKMTKNILQSCKNGNVEEACTRLQDVLNQGYSPIDFITTMFRVVQKFDCQQELKLIWIRHIAFTNIRISKGLQTHMQLTGLLAQLCMESKGIKRLRL